MRNGAVQVVIHTFTRDAMSFPSPFFWLMGIIPRHNYHIRQEIASLLWLMYDQWAVLVVMVYF